MVYLDISINIQAKALEMIEDPKIDVVAKKIEKEMYVIRTLQFITIKLISETM